MYKKPKIKELGDLEASTVQEESGAGGAGGTT